MNENVGYTLPVFACGAAIAACQCLQERSLGSSVRVNLIEPAKVVDIDIERVVKIDSHRAIAIAISDSGAHLDLTHNTPVWALVELQQSLSGDRVEIRGGEGVGKQVNYANEAAIYSYAKKLIRENIETVLKPRQNITITIILPEGRKLARRTSNAAFGVVEGLSLLGTTGIVQPLTAAKQLEAYQKELKTKAKLFDSLVFCIGENGLDLAQQAGIKRQRIVKTANWIGAMLATAGFAGVKSILLFGYHGKLIKLAGGIFHTHNHLADGRLEILTSYCARLGLTNPEIEQIFNSPTVESALKLLQDWDRKQKSSWQELVYEAIAEDIDRRSQKYIYKYTEQNLCVGSVLFDRQRKIIKKSSNAMLLLSDLC